jgi:molecular chaperone DnaJ
MPRLKSDVRGDLFAHIDVEIPTKLSKRERELLEELAAEMGETVDEKRSPLQKLRDIFE